MSPLTSAINDKKETNRIMNAFGKCNVTKTD